MKRGFTLLEVLLSIGIFAMLLVFLYETLEQTKLENKIVVKKEKELKKKDNLYNLLFEDISESSKVSLLKDNNLNSILKIVSKNTYHNSYYNHITYLIDSSFRLVRIESKNEFNLKEKLELFYTELYINPLVENIEFFEVYKDDISIKIVFKEKEKKNNYINVLLN